MTPIVATTITVTTATLPNGSSASAYTATLTSAGGVGPFAWAVSAGTLPPGLTLAGATGVIAGTPASAAGSPYRFSVTVKDGDGTTSPAQALSITIAGAGSPLITPGGIGPVYSSSSTIQPGSWVTIYGTNLASATKVWDGDFPATLGGVSVTINGKAAYLWFVSAGQINLQAPGDTATGLVDVVVTNAIGSTTAKVTLAPASPSFSLLGDAARHLAGVILTPAGNGAYGGGTYDLAGPVGGFAFNTRPVRAGETLILYGVGFGPTTPAVAAGRIFSGAAATQSPVTVTIGGVSAPVAFAGITAAGLYQFNITVPANTGLGDKAVVATIGGLVQTAAGPVLTVGGN